MKWSTLMLAALLLLIFIGCNESVTQDTTLTDLKQEEKIMKQIRSAKNHQVRSVKKMNKIQEKIKRFRILTGIKKLLKRLLYK